MEKGQGQRSAYSSPQESPFSSSLHLQHLGSSFCDSLSIANREAVPISGKKVRLEYSHTHSFPYYMWLLSYYNPEWHSCGRDSVACQASNIYSLVLWSKDLPTLGITHCYSLKPFMETTHTVSNQALLAGLCGPVGLCHHLVISFHSTLPYL